MFVRKINKEQPNIISKERKIMARIALVGASSRVTAFLGVLRNEIYKGVHEVVAMFDIDPGKMEGFKEKYKLDVPCFTDFDEMCDTIKPDMVIVTTVDATHAEFVIKAMDRKIAVVSEKPLCINAEQCKQIRDARARNPEVFAVTSHNARYSPLTLKVKEMIDNGVIGKVLRMEYTEMLDRKHGTSYFRRWNSRRACSNGLELHKSCHHFDKMNFLLDSKAIEITGMGDLTYHGQKNPHKYEGKRCHECEHKDVCPDFFAYDKEFYKSDAIYTPDLCIWSPDIDIEDNYAAVIKFECGVLCTYSICAHSQYEGEVIIIEGETGRLEAKNVYFRDINDQSNTHDTNIITQQTLTLCRFGKGEPESIEIPKGVGGHGGADLGIFGKIFATPPDPNIPTMEDGIQAVLMGAALVESIQKGGNVIKVQEMI